MKKGLSKYEFASVSFADNIIRKENINNVIIKLYFLVLLLSKTTRNKIKYRF